MNVYDQAHQLATAVKQSEEFKQFDAVKKQVEANPELHKAVQDLLSKQMQLQTSQLMGQQMDPEALGQLQQLSAVLMQDPLAANYMQCQMRFTVMMSDVYQILGEVSDFGLGSQFRMP